jgi:hypothetical protein
LSAGETLGVLLWLVVAMCKTVTAVFHSAVLTGGLDNCQTETAAAANSEAAAAAAAAAGVGLGAALQRVEVAEVVPPIWHRDALHEAFRPLATHTVALIAQLETFFRAAHMGCRHRHLGQFDAKAD